MFIDIACNITCEDLLNDIDKTLADCKNNSVMPLFVGLDIESSIKCLELAKIYNTCCFQGIHPNHITEDDIEINENIFSYSDDHVAGIGECGLDYYRSSNRESQIKIFQNQIGIYDLPYFYHCRNSKDTDSNFSAFHDFCRMAQKSGVVHSFDGTIEEAKKLLSMGFYIGINGCSMKTKENIDVIKYLPLNRILLETDSPYCQIRRSHQSSQFVAVDKSKFNTPVNIKKVAEVVSKIKNIPIEELELQVYENTMKLFPKIKKYVDFWRSKDI